MRGKLGSGQRGRWERKEVRGIGTAFEKIERKSINGRGGVDDNLKKKKKEKSEGEGVRAGTE